MKVYRVCSTHKNEADFTICFTNSAATAECVASAMRATGVDCVVISPELAVDGYGWWSTITEVDHS